MPGPTWMINATSYGHGDMLNPFFVEVLHATKFCAFNEEGTTDEYRQFVAGEILSLMFGEC